MNEETMDNLVTVGLLLLLLGLVVIQSAWTGFAILVIILFWLLWATRDWKILTKKEQEAMKE